MVESERSGKPFHQPSSSERWVFGVRPRDADALLIAGSFIENSARTVLGTTFFDAQPHIVNTRLDQGPFVGEHAIRLHRGQRFINFVNVTGWQPDNPTERTLLRYVATTIYLNLMDECIEKRARKRGKVIEEEEFFLTPAQRQAMTDEVNLFKEQSLTDAQVREADPWVFFFLNIPERQASAMYDRYKRVYSEKGADAAKEYYMRKLASLHEQSERGAI